MVDARKFLLSSDYPMDKIVGFKSGQVTVASGPVPATIDIPHELGFTPLPLGSWSLSSTFDTSYPPVLDYNGTGARPSVTIQTDGTNLRVVVDNQTGSSKTVYWRAFFLAPSNVNADVPPNAVNSIPFTFNSDYNYTKLLKEDYVTATSATVEHNLGYRPQVALWLQRGNGFVAEYDVSDTRSPIAYAVEVTDNAIVITRDTSIAGVHYRIYADD